MLSQTILALALAGIIVLTPVSRPLYRRHRHRLGATAIEYGLIAALVSVAAITALTSMGDSLSSILQQASCDLSLIQGEMHTDCPAPSTDQPQ